MDTLNIYASSGNGRDYLFAQGLLVHKGIVVYIGGGEQSHIGSTVVSLPITIESESKIKTSCTSSVINLPSHKDEVFARSTAEKLCKKFRCSVCVTCGVHNDNISKNEIDILTARLADIENQLCDEISRILEKNPWVWKNQT